MLAQLADALAGHSGATLRARMNPWLAELHAEEERAEPDQRPYRCPRTPHQSLPALVGAGAGAGAPAWAVGAAQWLTMRC